MGLLLFKRLILVLALALLASPACATVFVIEPVDQRLEAGEDVRLGSISPGETLRLIVRKKSNLGGEWDTLSVNAGLLPPAWGFESVETDKSVIGRLAVPPKAEVSVQRIEVTASSSSQPLLHETFYANLAVKRNLLNPTIEGLNQDAVAGETASFRLTVDNSSIAEHDLHVSSSLPSYWFEPINVKVEPLSTKEVDLNVNALAYGTRSFSFKVSSNLNQDSFTFPALLYVEPTLRGKYFSSLFGFPLFSPSLLPCYLINGFLALVS